MFDEKLYIYKIKKDKYINKTEFEIKNEPEKKKKA